MDPSQASGEFSGNNESGWTAYIGSHICTETSYSDDDVKIVEEDGNNGHDDDDDESDDSMASDASSGPSHLQYLGTNSEGSHGSDHQFTKHKDNDHKSLFSVKRTSKQASKRRYGKNAEVKEEEEDDDDLVEAHSAASSHI